MIEKEEREAIACLVDELRMRGVHVFHYEKGDLKLQIHVNAVGVEGAVSDAVKARLLSDPKTPAIVREQLEREQEDADLTDAG